MKKLKFSDPTPELVLNGKKCTTWRINDDKNITISDILSLCRSDGEEFAKAKVTQVREILFENLTGEDKEAHEKFSSDEEMYQIYSKYYNMNVTPKTKVKIIRFRLI